MKMSEMFPSKYLKADDLEGDTVVTITGVMQETMKDKNNKDTVKYVLLLEETKPLVLNVTNARAIESLYGNETDNWIGKQVTLYATEVEAFGEQTEAIRVRNAKMMQRRQPTAPKPAGVVPSAKETWNELARAAKAHGLESLLPQYRPAPDADNATVLKAAEGLRKHLEAETDLA